MRWLRPSTIKKDLELAGQAVKQLTDKLKKSLKKVARQKPSILQGYTKDS